MSCPSAVNFFSLLFCYYQMGVYALGIVFWRANSSSWCPSQKEPPRTINLTPVPSLTLNQIKKGCKANPRCNGQPSATMAVPVCPSETDQRMGCAQAAIPTFPLPARHTLLLLRVGQQQPVEFNLALPSPATSSGSVSGVYRVAFLHCASTG